MANSGTKLHGKNAAIFIADVGGASTRVANKVEWNLSLNRDYVDATVFGDTNKTYLVGLKDISGTFAGILDVSGDLLLTATDEDVKVLYLYGDDTGSPVLLAHGPSFIDSAISASNTDAVRITGNFRAQGAWEVDI